MYNYLFYIQKIYNSVASTLTLRQNIIAERERWSLWLPVIWACGIALYFSLPIEPPSWSGFSVVLGAIALIFMLRRHGLLILFPITMLILAAGFTSIQLRSAVVSAPILEKELGPITITGELLSFQPKAASHRLLLYRLDEFPLDPEKVPERVRVNVNSALPLGLLPGHRVRVKVVLRPPPEPAAPGSFDFARQAYFKRLGAVGYAISKVEIIKPLPASTSNDPLISWSLFWEGLRVKIDQRIAAVLEGEKGAIASALITGLRGGVSAHTQEVMRDAGLAHLLAISGLHMGIVSGWIFFTIRGLLALSPSLALRYPIKKWAAILAIISAFLYLFLAGATIPTQRAFLMVGTYFLAIIFERRALSLRLVAWAAFAVLLIAPESLISASFQLSFAAVVALIAAYEWLTPRMQQKERQQNWLSRGIFYIAGVALTSLIATVGTTPLVAYNFNRVAIYGVLGNLLAVPLTALWVMPWAVLAMLLMPFGLEAFALIPMGWGIDVILTFAREIAALPNAVIAIKQVPTLSVGLIVLGGLWLCVWRKSWRIHGLLAISLGGILAINAPVPDIFISAKGNLVGVTLPSGDLAASKLRGGRFEREVWMRIAGSKRSIAWENLKPEDGASTLCDALGCTYRNENNEIIAYAENSAALEEDCRRAKYLVSQVPVFNHVCANPILVIDRFDLWLKGAHTIRFTESGPRVESVRAVSGRRPWVQWRKSSQKSD